MRVQVQEATLEAAAEEEGTLWNATEATDTDIHPSHKAGREGEEGKEGKYDKDGGSGGGGERGGEVSAVGKAMRMDKMEAAAEEALAYGLEPPSADLEQGSDDGFDDDGKAAAGDDSYVK